MEQQKNIQHPWLMTIRGAIVGLIGVLLFSFTEVSHAAISYGIGASLLAGGACLVWFGTANRRIEPMVPWLILGGLLDGGFGVGLLVYADKTGTDFLDLLGFWALVFAVLQASQAIYSYIGPGESTADSTAKIIHVLLVVASAWLAFAVLMLPNPADKSLGLTGLLPLVMGVLLIILHIKLRSNATVNVRDRPVVDVRKPVVHVP